MPSTRFTAQEPLASLGTYNNNHPPLLNKDSCINYSKTTTAKFILLEIIAKIAKQTIFQAPVRAEK